MKMSHGCPNWCYVVSAQVHVYVHKHEVRMKSTCMGRNGLLTCAREVIMVITYARSSYYVRAHVKSFHFFFIMSP